MMELDISLLGKKTEEELAMTIASLATKSGLSYPEELLRSYKKTTAKEIRDLDKRGAGKAGSSRDPRISPCTSRGSPSPSRSQTEEVNKDTMGKGSEEADAVMADAGTESSSVWRLPVDETKIPEWARRLIFSGQDLRQEVPVKRAERIRPEALRTPE